MASPKSKPGFEEMYRQLEEKVALLEQGGLSLDDSLAAYEEAVDLAKKCQELLDTAELRITKLRETVTADDDGQSVSEEPALDQIYEAEMAEEESEEL